MTTPKRHVDDYLHIRPDETLWITQRKYSRSGLSRRFDVYIIREGELIRVTPIVASAAKMPWNDDGIKSYDDDSIAWNYAYSYRDVKPETKPHPYRTF